APALAAPKDTSYRVPNSFVCFRSYFNATHNPEGAITQQQVSILAGAAWHALEDAQRAVWQAKAEAVKAEAAKKAKGAEVRGVAKKGKGKTGKVVKKGGVAKRGKGKGNGGSCALAAPPSSDMLARQGGGWSTAGNDAAANESGPARHAQFFSPLGALPFPARGALPSSPVALPSPSASATPVPSRGATASASPGPVTPPLVNHHAPRVYPEVTPRLPTSTFYSSYAASSPPYAASSPPYATSSPPYAAFPSSYALSDYAAYPEQAASTGNYAFYEYERGQATTTSGLCYQNSSRGPFPCATHQSAGTQGQGGGYLGSLPGPSLDSPFAYPSGPAGYLSQPTVSPAVCESYFVPADAAPLINSFGNGDFEPHGTATAPGDAYAPYLSPCADTYFSPGDYATGANLAGACTFAGSSGTGQPFANGWQGGFM
ncbi:hypothetical protein HDZ31DRAFT_78463, partial [Schizophyllum fasciatum]